MSPPIQDKPAPGTLLRQAYDRLLSGEPTDLSDIKAGNTLRDLRTKYSMEIISKRQGFQGRHIFQLIGFWEDGELRSIKSGNSLLKRAA